MYLPPAVSRELARDAWFGRNPYNRHAPHCDNIDGVFIADLVAQYGSPLFVFSEKTIREKARRAKKAFQSAYPNTVFAWSYKTNYLAAVCNIFHQEGWLAEVVSDVEYDKAIKAGIHSQNIIYNGPSKSRTSLAKALHNGSVVQIDNWDELEIIEDIVQQSGGRPALVGIRVWMENRHLPHNWSKFGFALDNGEAKRAALRVIANPQLVLHTLHSHIGTQVLQPKAYAFAAEQLVALRQSLHEQTYSLVPCINLGGGFPSESLYYMDPEDTKRPPIEDFAEAITSVLNRLPETLRPQLRLETGRHLIDQAGYLVASVVAVKGSGREKEKPIRGKSSRGRYITDIGVNLLYTAAWFRINVMSTKPASPLITEKAQIDGCLCMAIDVIRNEVELPPLEVGDQLVLNPVGAYNLAQSMQFIALRPAVVLIGNGVNVIRRREELVDLDRCEQVPSYLQLDEEDDISSLGFRSSSELPEATPETSGLTVGAIEDGYRYKGGPKGDPNSWEKVQ